MIDNNIDSLMNKHDEMRNALNEMLADSDNISPYRESEIRVRLADLSYVVAQLNGIQSVLEEVDYFIEKSA